MSNRFSAWSAVLAGCLLLTASAGHAAEAKCPEQGAKEPPDVMLEVRLLTISENVFERIGVDFEAVKMTDLADKAPPKTIEMPAAARVLDMAFGCAFLDERQVRRLLEDVQGDRRCNLMQAPRLVVLSGQTGMIDTTDSKFFLSEVSVERADDKCIVRPKNQPVKLGFRMTARPVVSADRRFVRVALKINHTELLSNAVPLLPVEIRVPTEKTEAKNAPGKNDMTFYLQQPTFGTLAIDNTVNVPDGNTVVFAGKKMVEARCESGPPVLSKIPYVNRMVKNVGYCRESAALLIMVTPRIVGSAAAPSGVKQASFTCTPPQLSTPPPLSKPCTSCAAPPGRQVNILAELLKAYDEACSAGRTEEAERLARAALILNPACFQQRR